MRRLVIGDIHGNYKGMMQALERANYKPGDDMLISLGDIADGWPEVVKCFKQLQEFKDCGNTIFVRGNHDQWLLEDINDSFQSARLEFGKRATFEDIVPGKVDKIPFLKEFIESQVLYHISEDNIGFVHGGFSSNYGLGADIDTVYYWDRSLWETANSVHRYNIAEDEEEAFGYYTPPRYKAHEKVFIGHTQTIAWNMKSRYPEYVDNIVTPAGKPITVPMKRLNIINVDTGGGYDGKITVMDVDTEEFWQSDFSKELYPTAEMRN